MFLGLAGSGQVLIMDHTFRFTRRPSLLPGGNNPDFGRPRSLTCPIDRKRICQPSLRHKSYRREVATPSPISLGWSTSIVPKTRITRPVRLVDEESRAGPLGLSVGSEDWLAIQSKTQSPAPPRCFRFMGFRTPLRLTRRPLATGELSAFFFHLYDLRFLVLVFMSAPASIRFGVSDPRGLLCEGSPPKSRQTLPRRLIGGSALRSVHRDWRLQKTQLAVRLLPCAISNSPNCNESCSELDSVSPPVSWFWLGSLQRSPSAWGLSGRR